MQSRLRLMLSEEARQEVQVLASEHKSCDNLYLASLLARALDSHRNSS